MQMEKVREKAKKLGLKTSRKGKRDLIREIQVTEGNFPCFGTAVDLCDQLQCCWKEDCLPKNSE
ncbi:MAG: SAP domain-containing protein [Candidatus Methylomirabilis sp.]|nr:SAP domain-containing protein [Deltaproteobacteria bacterium]